MKLIFIFGMPASGKLTVAKELGALTGYKIFHNHLTVDLLLEVFEFGSPQFVALREKIWLDVFRSAWEAKFDGLIFTFAPERTVRQKFIDDTRSAMKACGGEIIFVELFCAVDEIEKRLETEGRREHKKLASVQLFRELQSAGVFASPQMPTPHLRIDTTTHEPRQAALLIAQACGAKQEAR